MGPRHGQGGTCHLEKVALAPMPGNLVKCFCELIVTAKRPVDELFMYYFHYLSSALAPPMDPAGGLSSQTPNLPTSGKNPAGVHRSGVEVYCVLIK